MEIPDAYSGTSFSKESYRDGSEAPQRQKGFQERERGIKLLVYRVFIELWQRMDKSGLE